MRHAILDVETIKSFDEVGGYFPEKLGVSFVGVIERMGLPGKVGEKVEEIRHELFEKDLEKLWKILENVDVAIGFNIDGFDVPALRPYCTGDVLKFATLDLMVRFKESQGHRISLDAIAGETLGTKKIGHGLDAIKYYADGELDKLAEYCMMDVEITRDIYDVGRIEKKVKFKNKWNDVVTAEVDFEFKVAEDAGMQMSLV
jgi:DEAD/DEAH box helicase domain-containing protein